MTDRTARIIRAFMKKRAAAVLTPEAEQAAMAPQDPSMGGGAPPPQGGAPMGPPPGDPSAMGGAPAGGPPPQGPQGAQGGQLPPEIMQDQGFIQWLAQQGVQFDPQSGMFYGPDGQPLPAEAIMQAYDAYMQEMQAQQGGMPPQGGAPAGPEGGMPPGGDPNAMGGMPPQGGQLPPEIMQDQQFMDFLAQAMGIQMDPNSGSFMDPQSGQPIPPDMIMQAYQAFQQQQQQMGGAPGGEGGAPEDGMGGADMGGGAAPGGTSVPPEVMQQLQSAVDASLEAFTQQLDKKIETLLDKLETVKMAIESMRDTDDQRDKQDREETKRLQDEIAAELNPQGMSEEEAPVEKTASVQPKPRKAVKKSAPENLFSYLLNPVK